MNTTRIGRSESRRGWPPQEILNQIRLTRTQRGVHGHIHWNMKSLMRNSTLDEVLEREVYQQPALMPLSPWLGRAKPGKPKLTVATANPGSRLDICWTPGGSSKAWLWLVQTRTGGQWTKEILPASKTARVWKGTLPEIVAVSAVGRNGELSAPSVLQARGSAR